MLGDTELSRLLLEFGKNADSDSSDGDNSGSDETVVAPVELAVKLEEGLADTLRHKASLALMKRAEVVPLQMQKRETLRHLKKSTRPTEARQQGAVKWANYLNYIRANSYLGVRGPFD